MQKRRKENGDNMGQSRNRFTRNLNQGLKASWPICLGYIPIGLAFGVLAQKAGLSWLDIALMSAVVFAGSSQFIAVSMLTGGAAAMAVIVTTFFVNLRHVLMSSSLSVWLQNEHRGKLSIFAYTVTDESFAVNYTRFLKGDWDLQRSQVVNLTAYIAWIVSTVAGGFCGHLIPAHSFGIDYALIAMFICLLSFQLVSRLVILTAAVAGLVSVTLSLFISGNAHVILASVFAATVGVGLGRLRYFRKIPDTE
jgi:4-azaleucine resistance transporter AzlC